MALSPAMAEINPYAPPSLDDAPLVGRARHAVGAWQQMGLVVLRRDGGRLPDRCVQCNAPSTVRLKKQLTWHHPALYVLLFVGVIIYVIAALLTRKSATVELGLCEEHQRKRRLGLSLAWGGVALSPTLVVAGVMAEMPEIILAGIGLFTVLFVTGVTLAQVAYPKKIDDDTVRFKAGRPFVESLPRAPIARG